MGNSCTKELSSISALINKAGGDANAARYKKTELNSLSTGLHSSESTTVKESQVKYAILHPQIRDLLLRLSYDEIQIILVSCLLLSILRNFLMVISLFRISSV